MRHTALALAMIVGTTAYAGGDELATVDLVPVSDVTIDPIFETFVGSDDPDAVTFDVTGSIEVEALGVYEWVGLALLEFGLGTVLGMIVSFPGHAVLGAAQVTSFAALQGPRQKTVAALVVLMAACLGWALSLHHALLHAVLELAQRFPVADVGAWSLAVSGDGLARLIHGLCLLALALATPVLLTAAVIDEP